MARYPVRTSSQQSDNTDFSDTFPIVSLAFEKHGDEYTNNFKGRRIALNYGFKSQTMSVRYNAVISKHFRSQIPLNFKIKNTRLIKLILLKAK